MLQKLILKNREIAVPVPLLTLGEAILWIEDSFLPKEAFLTSAILEDKELINELHRKSIKDIPLEERSRLQIKIETPTDLSNQSLDVVCDLACGIAIRIHKVADDFRTETVGDLEDIHSDIQILLELLAHTKGLLNDVPFYLATMNELGQEIHRGNLSFGECLSNGNWSEIACVLGKRIEPSLRKLAWEGEELQLNRLTDAFSKVG